MKFAEKNLLGMLLFLILGAALVGGLLFGVYSLLRGGTLGGCSGDIFAGNYKAINEYEFKELVCINNKFDTSKGIKITLEGSETYANGDYNKVSANGSVVYEGDMLKIARETKTSVKTGDSVKTSSSNQWYRDSYVYDSTTKTKWVDENYGDGFNVNAEAVLNQVLNGYDGYGKTFEADYNQKKGRITLKKESEGEIKDTSIICFYFIVDQDGYLYAFGYKETTTMGTGEHSEIYEVMLRQTVKITYPAVIDSYVEVN